MYNTALSNMELPTATGIPKFEFLAIWLNVIHLWSVFYNLLFTRTEVIYSCSLESFIALLSDDYSERHCNADKGRSHHGNMRETYWIFFSKISVFSCIFLAKNVDTNLDVIKYFEKNKYCDNVLSCIYSVFIYN